MSTQCQHKLVYIANRRSSLPLLYSLDGSSLLQQSNCLGGSQQECGRLLALPFLAKLCASTAAVPARPAQHTRQGSHNPEGSHVGNSPQGLFGSGWKTPGKKEKGWKGQNTGTYLHVVKSHHLSQVSSHIWKHIHAQRCFHHLHLFPKALLVLICSVNFHTQN